jgi:2-dehydropantoate 2-reductase
MYTSCSLAGLSASREKLLYAPTAMNIHLLGVGSVGALTAFHLRRSLLQAATAPTTTAIGQDKIILHFRSRLDKGKEVSLTVEPPGEDSKPETLSGFAQAAVGEEQQEGPIDILFVALKADQTLSALEKVRSRLRPESEIAGGGPSTIILLQNGVGQDEALLHRFFPSSSPSSSSSSSYSGEGRIARPYILLGSNTHGTWRRSAQHIVHAAKGTMHFGLSRAASAADAVSPSIERALLSLKPHTEPHEIPPGYETLQHAYMLLSSPTIRSALHTTLEPSESFAVRALRKLVVNCALNPLSALEGCRNGELLEREECLVKIRGIVGECAEVLAARAGEEAEGEEEGKLSFPSLLTHVHAVIRQTAPNWSSMVQDVRSGRGGTEIDFINGTIVRWGKEVGVSTPVNEELVRAIREKVGGDNA